MYTHAQTHTHTQAAMIAGAVAKVLSAGTPPTTPTTPTTAAVAAPTPASGAGAATATQAVTEVTPAVTWSKHIDPESGQAYLVSSSGQHMWVEVCDKCV